MRSGSAAPAATWEFPRQLVAEDFLNGSSKAGGPPIATPHHRLSGPLIKRRRRDRIGRRQVADIRTLLSIAVGARRLPDEVEALSVAFGDAEVGPGWGTQPKLELTLSTIGKISCHPDVTHEPPRDQAAATPGKP